MEYRNGEISINIARCFEKSGKQNEAIDTYREIAQRYPKSLWATKAQVKLQNETFICCIFMAYASAIL